MQVELCEGRARRMQEEDGQDPFKQLSAQVSRIFAGTAPLFFLSSSSPHLDSTPPLHRTVRRLWRPIPRGQLAGATLYPLPSLSVTHKRRATGLNSHTPPAVVLQRVQAARVRAGLGVQGGHGRGQEAEDPRGLRRPGVQRTSFRLTHQCRTP